MTPAEVKLLKKQVRWVKHKIDKAHLALQLLPDDELPDAVMPDLNEALDKLETITLEL